MRSNTGRPSAVIVFRTFWPTWISVICLEKLRDLTLGPMALFQRPICVSIRLRRLYPFRTIQDRESVLQQASAANSMKMIGVTLGRIRVAGTAAEEFSCQRL